MRRAGRWAWLVALGAVVPAGDAQAAAVTRVGAGANAAAIQAAVDQFRGDLAGVNNGVGGAFLSGRREINWDGVPDTAAEPNPLPFDFFNNTSPRGVVFESLANIGGQHQFRVSARSGNPTATVPLFGNLDATYFTVFQTFSPERLFAPRFSNALDVFFYLPGTSIPATVKGFGAVFADVDSSNTFIEFYGADGKKLAGSSLNVANNGLSFIGTSFNAGERVARVQMRLGNANLQSGNVDGTAGTDVVALDDFVYGEPQADPSVFRFAGAQVSGAEGGTATVSVVRTGRGPGSVAVATSDGSATAGSDYTALSQTLTFGLDETVKTVSVPLAADGAAEGDETLKLALSSPTGGTLGGVPDTTLTILDRPPPAPPVAAAAAAPLPDRSAPAVVLGRVASRMTRTAFLRGVKVAITPNEPSSLLVELLGTTGRAVLARAGTLELASRTLPLAAGTRTVVLRPTRRLVANARRTFTARLRVTATDAAGNRSVVTRPIVVRQPATRRR